MTQPGAQQPPPPGPEESESSLVPALLTVYALYLAWRGANAGFRGGATQVRRALNLDVLIGGVLAAVAHRALDGQRRNAGRSGDELWAHADGAVRVAVEVGLDVLSEALLWTDRHTSGDPSTVDAATAVPGEATVPTGENPPDLLARMLATAVTNAAMLAAAAAAGWTRKTWTRRADARVRDTHRILHGQTLPLGDSFEVRGHKLRFPGDPAAPISETANCRCWLAMSR